jgi:hypothetical protein
MNCSLKLPSEIQRENLILLCTGGGGEQVRWMVFAAFAFNKYGGNKQNC